MPVAFITVKLPNGTLVPGLRDQWGNSTKSPKQIPMDAIWISYGYHMDIIWISYGYHMDNGNARFCQDVLDIELIVILLFLRVEVHLDVDLKTRIEVGTLEFLTQAC